MRQTKVFMVGRHPRRTEFVRFFVRFLFYMAKVVGLTTVQRLAVLFSSWRKQKKGRNDRKQGNKGNGQFTGKPQSKGKRGRRADRKKPKEAQRNTRRPVKTNANKTNKCAICKRLKNNKLLHAIPWWSQCLSPCHGSTDGTCSGRTCASCPFRCRTHGCK